MLPVTPGCAEPRSGIVSACRAVTYCGQGECRCGADVASTTLNDMMQLSNAKVSHCMSVAINTADQLFLWHCWFCVILPSKDGMLLACGAVLLRQHLQCTALYCITLYCAVLQCICTDCSCCQSETGVGCAEAAAAASRHAGRGSSGGTTADCRGTLLLGIS